MLPTMQVLPTIPPSGQFPLRLKEQTHCMCPQAEHYLDACVSFRAFLHKLSRGGFHSTLPGVLEMMGWHPIQLRGRYAFHALLLLIPLTWCMQGVGLRAVPAHDTASHRPSMPAELQPGQSPSSPIGSAPRVLQVLQPCATSTAQKRLLCSLTVIQFLSKSCCGDYAVSVM